MNDFLDVLKIVVGATVLSLLFIALIAVLIQPLMVLDCDAKTEDMGFENRYSFWGGCQIEVESGKWIPLKNYYFKEE